MNAPTDQTNFLELFLRVVRTGETHPDYKLMDGVIHKHACLLGRTQLMDDQQLIDQLTYINYAHNRGLAPHLTVESWKNVYGDATVDAMEARYQREQKKEAA